MPEYELISAQMNEHGIEREYGVTATSRRMRVTAITVEDGTVALRCGDPRDFDPTDGPAGPTERFTPEEAEHVGRVLIESAAKAREAKA